MLPYDSFGRGPWRRDNGRTTGTHLSLAHGLDHYLRPIVLNEMASALHDRQLALWRERRRLRLTFLPERFTLR
jgi:hypothetical protein